MILKSSTFTGLIKFTTGICFIFIGGLIYLIFRDPSLLMFDWFKNIGLENVINQSRGDFSSIKTSLHPWIIYSLPNTLWFAGGLLLVQAMWDEKHTLEKLFWIMSFASVGIVSEAAQYFNFISGTFDFADLVPMLLVAFVFIYFESVNSKFISERSRYAQK